MVRLELMISKNLVQKEIEIQGWDGTAWQTLQTFNPGSLTIRKKLSSAGITKVRTRYAGSERLLAAQTRAIQLAP
jgi:hypothetical protein